jgi:Flp pilus assembly protein TadG
MQTNTHKIRARLRRDNGQTLVEFALILPLLALLVLGIFQFGVAFHNYLAITDAVRVGARAAAVKRMNDPCGAAQSAIQSTVSDKQWDEMSASFDCDTPQGTDDPGDQITISVKYAYEIGLPDFSASGDLTSSATERLE